MIDYKEFRNKQLKEDPELKRYYDELTPEFSVIRAVIKKRKETGLTQSELADRIDTKQSAIARFESGDYNPTLSMLNKIANALGAKLKVSIT